MVYGVWCMVYGVGCEPSEGAGNPLESLGGFDGAVVGGGDALHQVAVTVSRWFGVACSPLFPAWVLTLRIECMGGGNAGAERVSFNI